MKAKVFVETIRRRYAMGWLYSDTLTMVQLGELGLIMGADYADAVEVEVDFKVRPEDNRVIVTKVIAFNGGEKTDVTHIVRIGELEGDIEEGYCET